VSVVLIVGIVLVVWIGVCLLVLAMCASAKEGDGEIATLAPESPAGAAVKPRRPRLRRRAPALS